MSVFSFGTARLRPAPRAMPGAAPHFSAGGNSFRRKLESNSRSYRGWRKMCRLGQLSVIWRASSRGVSPVTQIAKRNRMAEKGDGIRSFVRFPRDGSARIETGRRNVSYYLASTKCETRGAARNLRAFGKRRAFLKMPLRQALLDEHPRSRRLSVPSLILGELSVRCEPAGVPDTSN